MGLSLESSLFYHRPGSQTGDQPEQFIRSDPLSGRYVKVMKYQQETNFFCFTEIEVYQTEGLHFIYCCSEIKFLRTFCLHTMGLGSLWLD